MYLGRKIGFCVSFKSNINYGKRQTVKFDNIFVNNENGYDVRTGVFTCPVAGSYMFVVDVLLNKNTRLSLKLNTTTVALLYRDSIYSKAPFVQASKTILLRLKQGDHVKVVCEFNNFTQDLLELSYIENIAKKRNVLLGYCEVHWNWNKLK